MSKPVAQRPYMTPKEVAAELMVTPETVRLWVQKGLLDAELTAGGHRRFKRADIELFARNRRSRGARTEIRVLIVDDEPQMVQMLAEAFDYSDLPFVTEIANSGFEAGHKVTSFKPDVVLLDLMMPGVDGFDVCQRISQDRSLGDVKVVAMTGYYSTENVERIKRAGAATCLAKPLDLDEVEHLLQSLVGYQPAANG